MSPRDIDEMEYAEIISLFEYWKQNPPAHILIQGFFKMGDNSTPSRKSTEEQMKELMSMFPQGMG